MYEYIISGAHRPLRMYTYRTTSYLAGGACLIVSQLISRFQLKLELLLALGLMLGFFSLGNISTSAIAAMGIILLSTATSAK